MAAETRWLPAALWVPVCGQVSAGSARSSRFTLGFLHPRGTQKGIGGLLITPGVILSGSK
jgi:hypothetical protein